MAFNIVAGVNNAVYGSVSGSGSYVEGAEVTLEVTANDGYRFVEWDDGNADNPRVFNATEDVTLVATLEAIPEYAISVTTNDNSLGTVSGAGTFREGTSTQISATPYVHSRFVNWEDGTPDNPRTITVSAAATYKAIFEAVNYFTISTDVNDANLGSVTGAGEYDEGDAVTLTAIPETGCRFVGWNDGNTDNPRTFTSSANATYTATFEEIQYTDVTIASNDVSWGTVSGAISGNIETGTQITLTATPSADYELVGWQVDGEMLEDEDDLELTITVTGAEMDIIAVFAAIVFYQVTLLSSDLECGHIAVISQTSSPRGTANNLWQEGTVLELQAVCESGGKFLNWGDGSIELTKSVVVHENMLIRANFYPVTGLILVTKKIFQHAWNTIKSFFSASTGASKIGAPANNALGATTLADVVNSVGQPGGIAMLNNSGKVAAADIDGTLSNDTSGNAATASVADKVGTSTVGSSTEPVYINAGTPTACGGSLAVDITGNAATATTASACSGNAATATTATNVLQEYGTANYNRPILLSKLENITTTTAQNKNAVFSNNFYANPSTGLMYSKQMLIGKNIGLYSDSDGTGESFDHLRLGNATAQGTSGAKAAYLNLYGTGTTFLGIAIGTTNTTDRRLTINSNFTAARTYTLPDATGTIALTSSNITGSSASCTGNAATATTATNTNNAKLTHTVGNTEYPLVFGTSFVITDAQQALRIGTPTATAANCALRAKAYCAAANTQGEAYLVCGNNIALASANNSRGSVYLYGTNTGYTRLLPGNNTTSNITLTLPSATGTIALTSSNITGSSASCTGNAATATTASACSGNAASATYATNIRVTDTDSNTWYPLVFSTGSAASTNYVARVDADSILAYPGTAPAAGTQGNSYIQIGNSKATATAGNKRGRLRIYGVNTSYTEIVSGVATTARTFTLPDIGGLAVVSSDSTVYNISVVTALPSSPNAKTVYLVK